MISRRTMIKNSVLAGTGFAMVGARASHPSWEVSIAQNAGPQSFPLSAHQFGLPSKAFTLALHLRANAFRKTGTLLKLTDSLGHSPIQLEITQLPSGEMVQFEVITDFRPQPLRVGIPVALLQRGQSHNLLLRYMGFRLDFFVDGVLVDQEWPMGILAPEGIQAVESDSTISHIQVWPAAMSDEEVEQMNGGKRKITQRNPGDTRSRAASAAVLSPARIQHGRWRCDAVFPRQRLARVLLAGSASPP
jgi:hypothetical protein